MTGKQNMTPAEWRAHLEAHGASGDDAFAILKAWEDTATDLCDETIPLTPTSTRKVQATITYAGDHGPVTDAELDAARVELLSRPADCLCKDYNPSRKWKVNGACPVHGYRDPSVSAFASADGLRMAIENLRDCVNSMGGSASIAQKWLMKRLDTILSAPAAPVGGNHLCPIAHGSNHRMELQWVCETCGYREAVKDGEEEK